MAWLHCITKASSTAGLTPLRSSMRARTPPSWEHSDAEVLSGQQAQMWQALGSALESALTGRPAGVIPPSQMIDGAALERRRFASPSSRWTHRRQRVRRHDQVDSLHGTARADPDMVVAVAHPHRSAGDHRSRFCVARLVSRCRTRVTDPLSGDSEPLRLHTSYRPRPRTVAVPAIEDFVEGDPTPIAIREVAAYDPLGDGEEQPGTIGNLTDSDVATFWRTERYFDPLPLLKEGVGVTLCIVRCARKR